MNFGKAVTNLIFNIQKCSIHDGDGLRTIVFFKGCPLSCKWCSNPESQSAEKEIMEYPRKCISCGWCRQVCPEQCVYGEENEFRIDRTRCIGCMKCTERCFAEAKVVVGEEKTADEIYREVSKDRLFYQRHGGGVTFSGGEPLMQPQLLTETAKLCSQNGINVVIETCGMGLYEQFSKALPYVNAIFFDIKHMDDAVHRQTTGASNKAILDNLRKISSHGIPITVRTPVIPGINNQTEDIDAIAEFIKDIPNVIGYELLAYHDFGRSKYTAMSKEYELDHIERLEGEDLLELVRRANRTLNKYGKECFCTIDNEKVIAKEMN